jgi:hypothetical protein
VGYYKWGPWVNGGAWIQTPTGKLDLLYRNIEQVQRVIDESQEGLYQHDYYQQPTFGFVSIIYLSETKCCLPLFDPQRLLQKLKRSVEIYPAPLQQKQSIFSVAESGRFGRSGRLPLGRYRSKGSPSPKPGGLRGP